MNEEIWICGSGLVSPLGLDLTTVGQRLEDGENALSEQTQFDGDVFGSPLCAAVQGYKANAYVKNRKNLKLMSRAVRLGMGAIHLAATDAHLHERPENPERLGIIVGAGIALGQSRDLVAGIRQSFEGGIFSSARFGEVGPRAINPLWLLKGLSNNTLGFATAELDARGFNQNYCNSGVSGLQAIGEAFWALREGRADTLIAGGSDSAIDPFHYAGFSRLRALSSAMSAEAVRPFDERRDGFVLGEGAAYFVLKKRKDALADALPVQARILGSANMTAALQPLQSDPDIVAACIRRCLKNAQLDVTDVGGIIAHGNGSRRYDSVEARGINAVFGDHCPPVTTNKAQLGHSIAASGPISLAVAIYAGRTKRLPAIPNVEVICPDCEGINLTIGAAKPMANSVVLVLAAGLGGQVSSLLLEVIS